MRQRSLLAIRDLLSQRGVTVAGIGTRSVDVTPIVRNTECRFVRKAVDNGAVARAVALPGFEGLLGAPTQPRTTFLREFSDRVRVIACLDELPNLACSTHEAVTLSSSEWDRVGKACRVSPLTPVLVVWGPAQDVDTACREIVIRAQDAVQGIPSETRQALPDGTNGFERILPGPDRMYPDTDEPPIPLADARLDVIAREVPETPWDRVDRLRELGVGGDLAERLARHAAYPLFQLLCRRLDGKHFGVQGLASLLLDRHCARPALPGVDDSWWERTVDRLVTGEVVPEGVWCGGEIPPASLSPAKARSLCRRRLAALPSGGPQDRVARVGWIMARVMEELRGKVAGRVVRTWVEEALA
jgi:Glu-tRNA(Gln) amidotransferase subunit E-like FAD-binding protein